MPKKSITAVDVLAKVFMKFLRQKKASRATWFKKFLNGIKKLGKHMGKKAGYFIYNQFPRPKFTAWTLGFPYDWLFFKGSDRNYQT